MFSCYTVIYIYIYIHVYAHVYPPGRGEVTPPAADLDAPVGLRGEPCGEKALGGGHAQVVQTHAGPGRTGQGRTCALGGKVSPEAPFTQRAGGVKPGLRARTARAAFAPCR